MAFIALLAYDSAPMRRLYLALMVAVLASTPGCTYMYNVLFGAFGDHYTDGGATRYEKERDYEAKVESYGVDL